GRDWSAFCEGCRCPRRDHRPRLPYRGTVARFLARARPRRGRARRPQGRRAGRGEVHRRRPQVTHHLTVDQGEGSPRGGRSGAELSLRDRRFRHEPWGSAEGAHRIGREPLARMTKSELIEIITAKQKHLPAKDVELALKQILEIRSDALSQGERIELRGFGSFSLHFRPPRQGRNPKTGEAVALSGKHVPHFKPGKDLRERVNDGAGRPIRD